MSRTNPSTPRPHMRRLRTHAALVLLAAAVAGCAAQPVAPERVEAALRQPVAAFELEGRVLASNGDQAASGRIHWLHAAHGDEWTMYGPLGQIVARLVSNAAGAELVTADGRRMSAPDAQAMLPELLGVPAPVDGLAHWVQAVPRSGARVLRLDEHGRPVRISDAGWIIEYTDYMAPEPEAPPRRIEANWGDARIRLVIDAWTPQL
ncbi:MAG TPA: lipoprotein insertase outer membrane protein LolB [Rhodocyclaceae bacterium]|nr:lipoprotein insertase outer membrane protein LolB [Rhodocyclaceae bacterium]